MHSGLKCTFSRSLNQHVHIDFDLFRAGVGLAFRVLLCAFAVLLPAFATAEIPVSGHIRQHMLALKQSGELALEGVPIASRQVVPKLYERRNYSPVWSNTDSVQQLFDQIRLAYDEGLTPGDYHLDKLKSLQLQLEQTPGEPSISATYDVLLSDALFRLAYHLLFGKVDPETFNPDWNLAREINSQDLIE